MSLSRKLLIIAATLAVLAALNYLFEYGLGDFQINPYYARIINLIGINITLAVSLNLINGLAGQFSIGHAGFMAVGGYGGIHLIYEALKKTGGKTDGDGLIEAMKGMKWESPRGPISIDPETRDIVQNIYIRKVEKVDGELYNVEFQTFEAVKDAGKTKK